MLTLITTVLIFSFKFFLYSQYMHIECLIQGGREGRGTPSRLESHGSCIHTHAHTELHHALNFLLYSFSCPLGNVFLIQLALQLCVLVIRKSSQVTHVIIVIKYFLSLCNVIDPMIHTQPTSTIMHFRNNIVDKHCMLYTDTTGEYHNSYYHV